MTVFDIFDKKARGVGRATYPFRILGYYIGIVILIINHKSNQDLTTLTILFSAFAFVFPHISYFFYKYYDSDRKVELITLAMDSFFLGGFVNMLNFAFVPSFAFACMAISSHVAIRGFKKIYELVFSFLLGIGFIGLFNGFRVQTDIPEIVNILSVSYLGVFGILYSYYGFKRSTSLRLAEKNIEEQNKEIENKKEQLEEINKERNYLIGIAAHDLKSPLNQVIGLIEVLRLIPNERSNQEIETLNLIDKSIYRMRDMISKLLDVKTIETGEIKLNFQEVQLDRVLKEILENFEKSAREKKITIQADLQNEINIFLDQNYFSRIVENLLSNAIKFSPFGRNVYLKLEDTEGKVSISVRDEGPGISESDQKKLFIRFQRLSAQPTANEPSSGLGLSIVKTFVDAMAGKVWCESELDKGTTFIVEFDKSGSPVSQSGN
ncbi:ATP-binding protein [Fulvivirgaceae bacterium BMA10]|uniref:histidine kinase n=1 Tax=Splendidivirga corallicola TaxID=3051826 RepID=A0ABT8L1R8_9BACT|nr:ATP-binding protein [Fulvivirgaceae bacterium BMA10]